MRTIDSSFAKGVGRIDRRRTLKWLAASLASGLAGCARQDRYLGDEIPAGWLPGEAAMPGGRGYGPDPDLTDPTLPWPRTLSEAQRQAAAAFCDVILPADGSSPVASALGIHDFIDEWISAPYPVQRADRELILDGLKWLETESRKRFGRSFASAGETNRKALADVLAAGSSGQSPNGAPAPFFRRFRWIATGAYYSTEAGMADIGYIGNRPISGDYPGPDAQALAHLAAVLKKLDLPWPA